MAGTRPPTRDMASECRCGWMAPSTSGTGATIRPTARADLSTAKATCTKVPCPQSAGDWKDDAACGQGRLVDLTGMVYVGGWLNDKQDGMGNTESSQSRDREVARWSRLSRTVPQRPEERQRQVLLDRRVLLRRRFQGQLARRPRHFCVERPQTL